MKVLFRADASLIIGSGHIMRCLTLAKALHKQLAAECHFVCLAQDGHLQQLIHAQGFKVINLGLLDSIEHEAQLMLELCADDYDYLVVDHYQRDAEFEILVKPLARYLMVIDELINRPHLCDLLLDQWATQETIPYYQSIIPTTAKTLFGINYSLLRDEFIPYLNFDKSQSQRLLISFGGSDLNNNSRLVLQVLQQLNWQSPVDLVLGQNSPWNEQLKQEFGDLPYLTWHIQCDYMGKLMREARLSIGAGGGSHLERCISSLPALVMTVADNQRGGTQMFAKLGVCINLGEQTLISENDLAKALNNVWHDPVKLTQMAQAAHQLLPENGTNLVVAQMAKLAG